MTKFENLRAEVQRDSRSLDRNIAQLEWLEKQVGELTKQAEQNRQRLERHETLFDSVVAVLAGAPPCGQDTVWHRLERLMHKAEAKRESKEKAAG